MFWLPAPTESPFATINYYTIHTGKKAILFCDFSKKSLPGPGPTRIQCKDVAFLRVSGNTTASPHLFWGSPWKKLC